MATKAVTVTSTATELVAERRSTPHRTQITIKNNSSVTIYLGEDNTVTASTGMPLLSDDIFMIEMELPEARFYYRGAVWAITESENADVRVWEMVIG